MDSEGLVGSHTSLDLDEDGYPHISYGDIGNGDLKYAYQDASGWHIETVDSEGDIGYFTSLALDVGGHPHISYLHCRRSLYFCDAGDLEYAHRDTFGWHIETVDSEGSVGWSTSLALGAGGYPHISYHDYTNDDLKYAYYRLTPYHIYLPTILKED